jgi:hypothetical protein
MSSLNHSPVKSSRDSSQQKPGYLSGRDADGNVVHVKIGNIIGVKNAIKSIALKKV